MYNSKSMMMHMCMADGMMVMCRMFMCVQFSGFEGLVGTTVLAEEEQKGVGELRICFSPGDGVSAVSLWDLRLFGLL